MTCNPRLVFVSIPKGDHSEGDLNSKITDESATIDLDGAQLHGGLILKTLACSLDPFLRNRMRPFDAPGDMPAFRLGET